MPKVPKVKNFCQFNATSFSVERIEQSTWLAVFLPFVTENHAIKNEVPTI